MKIVAVIPVSQREDILKITIPKLCKQVHKVILVGNLTQDIKTSSMFWQENFPESEYYFCENTVKRGAKWQFAIEKAREFEPDILLISSSGGVFKDSYFDVEFTDVIGPKDIYYLDFQPREKRMIYWPGYNTSRSDEPIGLGRMVKASFLDKINWKLYPTESNTGLDFITMNVFRKHGAEVKVVQFPPLRISSYKYSQTNPFDRMLKNRSVVVKDMESKLKEFGL